MAARLGPKTVMQHIQRDQARKQGGLQIKNKYLGRLHCELGVKVGTKIPAARMRPRPTVAIRRSGATRSGPRLSRPGRRWDLGRKILAQSAEAREASRAQCAGRPYKRMICLPCH